MLILWTVCTITQKCIISGLFVQFYTDLWTLPCHFCTLFYAICSYFLISLFCLWFFKFNCKHYLVIFVLWDIQYAVIFFLHFSSCDFSSSSQNFKCVVYWKFVHFPACWSRGCPNSCSGPCKIQRKYVSLKFHQTLIKVSYMLY